MGDVDLTSPIISFTERIVYFMKRVLAALLCAGMLIVFASGCMGGGKQTNPEDVATGDEASSLDPKDYKNNFEGLCNYFAAYGYINPKYDDKNTEMDASLIGAKVGKKFTAIRIDDKDVNNITIELYEYDTDNIGEEGKRVIDEVKKNGEFYVFGEDTKLDGNEAYPADLSDNGKYLLIYTDTSTDISNVQRKADFTEKVKAFYKNEE